MRTRNGPQMSQKLINMDPKPGKPLAPMSFSWALCRSEGFPGTAYFIPGCDGIGVWQIQTSVICAYRAIPASGNIGKYNEDYREIGTNSENIGTNIGEIGKL